MASRDLTPFYCFLAQEIKELERAHKAHQKSLEASLANSVNQETKLSDQIARLEEEIKALSRPTWSWDSFFWFGFLKINEDCEEDDIILDAIEIAKNKQRNLASKKTRDRQKALTGYSDPEERRRAIRHSLATNQQHDEYNKKIVKRMAGGKPKNVEKLPQEDLDFLKEMDQKEVENKKKLLEKTQVTTAELQQKLEMKNSDLEEKERQVQLKRARIYELKGQKEHKSFNINAFRDENGHTFLMVAVLKGDLITAQLCLDLDARPDELCGRGLSPILVAHYFQMDQMMSLFAKNNVTCPVDRIKLWHTLSERIVVNEEKLDDWSTTLETANNSAIPSKTLFKKAAAFESDRHQQMSILSEADVNSRSLTFFDASLKDSSCNTSLRRLVLLEEKVFKWLQSNPSNHFLQFLRSLAPEGILKKPTSCSLRFACTRRAVVGLKDHYEVLGVPILSSQLVLFTPFVTNEVEGAYSVGVLIWAVVDEKEASLYKIMIENMEFSRTKVDTDDHFPSHIDNVMKLGKDMHLLDLETTSIYTCCPMVLYSVSVDDGELDQLDDPYFVPKKRVLDYDEKLSRALFGESEKDEEELLLRTGEDMSTQL